MTNDRWYPAVVTLDNKIYVIGGQVQTGFLSTSSVEMYNPATDTWEMKASLQTSRWGLMVAVVNGKIYAIGGETGSFYDFDATDVVEIYDPVADEWTYATSMPTARGYGGCGVHNDTIYVFGGYGDNESNAVEKYSPVTDNWITEEPMPDTRYTFMTTVVNNKFYLIGGWGVNLVEEYNPVTKEWTTKAPMPTYRGGSGIDVIGNNIYVVGGRGGDSNELEVYNVENDSWEELQPLPTPREGLAAAIIDNSIYALAGSVPINQGGLPIYTLNEATDLTPASIISLESVSTINPSCNGLLDGGIDITISGGTVASSYIFNWSTTNGSGLETTTEDQTELTAGIYDVTVTDDNDCFSEYTFTLIDPALITMTTENSVDASSQTSSDGSITVAASGGTGTLTYEISPGGNTNQTGIFDGLTPGDYTIEVSDENDCGPIVSNTITVGVVNEIEEILFSNSIKVYPNPTSNKLFIEINYESDQLKLEVLNIIGQTLFIKEVEQNGDSKVELDLSNYSKGVYFIRIYDEKYNYTRKVLVQ
ncbi:kelch repeat-containing protein [Bacteroidota bacterium]